MTNRINRSRWIVLLATGVLSIGGAGLSALVDTRPANIRAAEWAQANTNQLPKTLEAFTQLPMEYRRAVVNAASPELLSELWAQQLSSVLADTSLPSKERVVLERAKTLLTPELFKGRGDLKAAKQLCLDLHAVASKVEAGRLTTLGGISAPQADGVAVRLARGLESLFTLHAQDECNCATDSYCTQCQSPASCWDSSISGCVWHANGGAGHYCGCFGLWPCDGECGYIIIN